jgi:fluoride exporter
VPESPSSIGPATHASVARILAIAAGGACGTLSRYGISRAVITPVDGFPWSTLSVNVVGSFVLGATLTLVTERWRPTRFVRPFVAIGFCGGFTTYSTFSVEIAQRIHDGRVTLAMLYLAMSLILGLVAAGGGVVAARGRGGSRGGVAFNHGPIPDPDSFSNLSGGPDPDSDLRR